MNEKFILPDLSKLIAGEFTEDPAVLQKYSQDASIFEVMPQAVMFPKSAEDLKNLVRFVDQKKNDINNLSLTARGGGTDMSGGSLNESIILDFTKYFNRIVEFKNEHVTVQPGVYYRDMEKLLNTRGLMMPSYPASKMICTVGGMVANNSGGEKSLSYGQTKDYVKQVEAVLSDGNEYSFEPLTAAELALQMKQDNFAGHVYREIFKLIEDNYDLIKKAKPTTSKNSAGYFLWDVWDKKIFDLTKLLTGSQGTLGLITKIKFQLVRPRPKSELLVISLNDLSILGDLVHTVMQYHPESFESFDRHTFGLALKFLPDMIKKMKGSALKLLWQFLPELWLTLTGRMPNLVLIAEFTGEDERAIFAILAKVQTDLKTKYKIKTHVTRSADEAQKYWTIRRESFNLLRQHSKDKQAAPFIDDIIVHPDQLPEFLPQLNAILGRYSHLLYTIAGHAGDANFHIIPIMNLKDEAQHTVITKLSHEVYDLVLKYNGSITAEHNDGLIRTPYIEKMYGAEMTGLFRQVKQIFDPKNIFNPGKKVGATEEYALRHIKY
jgi:FAD/FMN-containing dehydrogenase